MLPFLKAKEKSKTRKDMPMLKKSSATGAREKRKSFPQFNPIYHIYATTNNPNKHRSRRDRNRQQKYGKAT